MTGCVLADAGPLYAAVDPHDAHHKRAARELERLAEERLDVMVCFPTLLETYSLVLFRLGWGVATRWLSEMNNGTLVNPVPEDYWNASRRLAAFPDQPITLFDATVAAIATRLGSEVWTYDHHFDVMLVPVWR